MGKRRPDGELWRWYAVLVIANELDLVFTYLGLSRGTFLEANPLVRPYLYTWWPFIMKLGPLAGLALAIAVVVRRGQRLHPRTLTAVRLAAVIYAGIVLLHIVTWLHTG
ncbi:MAG: DUF5658 family protein [Armatimonadota bacterium]|nr:DUF5658 family protein [Armatimonadota bacterium]MDR7451801.1 DUF5658 family protein [Armatimonadota bacterium]MDR7467426.1 DUF5658 family protein [Armatimonadota bacterium]MDR7494196.1 DUF5658 family protein [Armatimonadota bacterium]MDR7498838.1 DUF5658 family protein [Armatimonadota bacterium]